MNNAEYITAELGFALRDARVSGTQVAEVMLRLAPMINSGGDDNSPEMLALAQEVRDLCAPPLRHFVVRPTGNPSEYTLMAGCAFTDLDAARAFADAQDQDLEPFILVEAR